MSRTKTWESLQATIPYGRSLVPSHAGCVRSQLPANRKLPIRYFRIAAYSGIRLTSGAEIYFAEWPKWSWADELARDCVLCGTAEVDPLTATSSPILVEEMTFVNA